VHKVYIILLTRGFPIVTLENMKHDIKKSIIGPITSCEICFSKNLTKVISFGHHAIVQAYRTPENLKDPETSYPLNLYRCAHCGLLQLDYAIDPRIVFPAKYPYKTGMTDMLVKNFGSLVELLIHKYRLKRQDLAIDIGSNDGTLLSFFKEKHLRVLGIEPTNIADIAIKKGIPTIKNFFSESVARRVIKKYGRAKIIVSTNTFAHINNLYEFLGGIKELLTEDGVFVSESQYLVDIISNSEFDTIYHEHIRYYSLKPLQKLFTNAGLHLVDAEHIGSSGGSIRVYAMREGQKIDDRAKARVAKLIQAEERMGLYQQKTFQAFAEKSRTAKLNLIELLIRCKKGGARIAGVGSPGRSNTILNFSHIDGDYLEYIVERRGSFKIGLYTPGMHIPVVDERKLFQDQPEYALILSWHIGGELIKKLRALGYKGKFIIPLPISRILKI